MDFTSVYWAVISTKKSTDQVAITQFQVGELISGRPLERVQIPGNGN